MECHIVVQDVLAIALVIS